MPKGNEIAQAYISIIPEMSGIQGKITKELNADGVGQSAGKSIGSSMVSGLSGSAGKVAAMVAKTVAAGTAAAAAGVAALTKGAMDSYAEHEQLWGGVQKLYGAAGMTLEQYAQSVGKTVDDASADYNRLRQAEGLVAINAQNAFKTAGMSANEYMESATGFSAALIKSLGGDTVKAAEITDVAMRAISDNVNTFGSDAQSVTQAVMGLSRENYTMLDNLKLGYAGTKQGMMELINDSGVLGYTLTDTAQLSEVGFAKMIEAIQAVQEQQGIAGTTAREAASTIEGSISMAKAAWTNFLTELGKSDGDLEARMEDLVDSVIAVAENVIPRIGEIIGKIATELPGMVMDLAPVLGNAVTKLLDEVTGGAFSKALDAIRPALDKAGSAAKKLFDRLQPLLPVVQSIGEKVGGMFVRAVNLAADAFDWLAPVIGAIAEQALPLLDKSLNIAITTFDMIMPIVEPIAEFLSGALTDAITDVGTVFNAFAELVDDGWTLIKNGLKAVADFFKEKFGWIAELFGITVDDITEDANRMDSNVSTSAANLANKVGTKFGDMERDVSNKSGSAADSAEREAARMEAAWNRDLITNLDAQANTWSAESSLSSLYNYWNGKTIWFNTGGGGGFGGSGGGGAFASGAIVKHANGFIVDRPGRGVDITRHIAGEAGGEAIIPLTNRSYVAPFAKVVADFVNERTGGVTVTGNTFVVRKDSDIRAVAIAINQQAERERGARL